MGSAQSTSCEKLLVSCAPKNGDFQDNGNLSDMRNETITVLEIGHYREPCNDGRSMILHDFVGFRVRFENLIFLIKAEKFKTGISVTRPPRWGRDVVPRYVCENLEDCGEIRMEDLVAILKEPSPDYHLLSDNCRSYADATFKQVIRKFSETPSLSPERRSYLASFLNNAPPLMPDEVLRSVGSAAGKAVTVEVQLSPFIGVAAAGAAVVAHSTLATQVATFYTALRCAGIPITPADVQNAVQGYTAAQAHGPQLLHAVHAMNSLVPVHHVPTVPLILNGGVHTTSATQAVHAPLITHSVLHLLLSKAFMIAPIIAKGAVCVAPFAPPVAMAVAGLFIAYALYQVVVFVKDGTSLRQSFKKWWRSHFSRRPLKQAQGLPSM
ncbi:hypothetical protein BDL97_05G020100 [Sphagnum fallax]|jgi:hypothetical protein|nr:hypothetical protein BDL97_05G020100 [Sphagnum fallax]